MDTVVGKNKKFIGQEKGGRVIIKNPNYKPEEVCNEK
jgi:hypothetical protein